MSAPLTAANIDALIDTLDRAERRQPSVWRKPLFGLQEQLSKAQRTRRWIGAPLLGLALVAPGLLSRETDWLTWIGFSWVLGAIVLMLMQVALERLFPVLDRESRIQSLSNYFLPWRDEDEDRKHDAA